MIANTPVPPYYAVIFTSIKKDEDNGYDDMAKKMQELASKQPGYLGMESARNELGITVSYWKDINSIKNWKENSAHSLAREKGRLIWYQSFKVRIAKVDRDYEFQI